MITGNELALILSKMEDIKEDLKDEIREVKEQNEKIIDTMVTVTACKNIRNNCLKPQELNIKKLNSFTGLIAVITSLVVNIVTQFFGK